ncbi:LysR family transcriptional regulator [Loktanella sp. IMCC34160]|uniref:LysR family transcriptional regulator n=1 Tax=Loktanella sp. IMCC34160 TaxID=2510646 RepID=UPI00101D4436|nr:LysR family transcriptional regulator [Loktanella sp. IMCC34160]RYG93071.1 LysR family transcriptional regulator [Loktanella sp. IMCC34160]
MPRNLDLTALRSFVTVADCGGVTRAAGLMNLTQSAVSMQLKRLEEALDLPLLDRSGRGIALTPAGEQLLGYARRMLQLNDEALRKMTGSDFEGVLRLGVPHDIVYPVIPKVLHRFATDYPRVKVQLASSFTRVLRSQFERGELDVILTTEGGVDQGGQTLTTLPLVWVGAPGGQAWKQRPLPLAFEERCRFRQEVQAQLDRAGVPWEMAVESESTRSIEATVSADLAVHAMLEGTEGQMFEQISHNGTLPDLERININIYVAETLGGTVQEEMADQIRHAYRAMGSGPDLRAVG